VESPGPPVVTLQAHGSDLAPVSTPREWLTAPISISPDMLCGIIWHSSFYFSTSLLQSKTVQKL
jgi:hypothetical protein